MKKFNTHVGIAGRVRAICVIVVLIALAGCSTVRFAYNHGDTILYWWMQAYLDLDADQSGSVRKDIDKLFRWHRQTELTDYVALLKSGQRQLAGNMTQADLLGDLNDIKSRARRLLQKAEPELADIARSMRPEQLARMEAKFASNNDEFRKKFIRNDTERQQDLRFKKAMEQFDLWFGNFSREQEALIRKASDARPLENGIWLDERVRRQKRIVALLRQVRQEKLGREATIALIHDVIEDSFKRFDAPERKAFFDAYIDGTAQMVLTAVKIATPAQKSHAHKRMQGWIDDFNTLAADAK